MTGYPWSEKKSGEKYFFKVRTLSGNCVIRKGIFELSLKSGKSLGILKEQVREKSGNLEM